MSNKKVVIANLKDDGELTEELFKLVECPIPTDANLKDNEGNDFKFTTDTNIF